MKWSLLHIDNSTKPAVDPQVFTDLNLTSIFDKIILDVLACPCDKNTILARMQIFRMSEDPNFALWIENLRKSISEFSHQFDRLRSVKTELEGCFVLKQVIDVYQKLLFACTNSYNAVLLNRLSEQARQETVLTDHCQQTISRYSQLLEEFSSFSLQLQGNNYYLISNYDIVQKSISQEIKEDAQELFPDIVFPKISQNIGLSVNFVNALKIEHDQAYSQLIDMKIELEKMISWDILRLRDDISFYLEMLKFIKATQERGVSVCFPKISDTPIYSASDVIDPTLLPKLSANPVSNDIDFKKDEAIYWLCGTNGGGKTTYLKSVAINLLLFLSGCPILGREALIYPFRSVMTHFPADEKFNEGGRMNEELSRAHDILSAADYETFVFFNETFSSTDVRKGQHLAEELMMQLQNKECFCLFVSHMITMDRGSFPILTAMTDSENGNVPTYRIAKNVDADYGYVQKILQKYRMDKSSLYRRKHD